VAKPPVVAADQQGNRRLMATQYKHNTALDCWFLTGPTAAGKTQVALELAGRLDAEIVSLDSMAIYRGMDIGTAKPSAAEREQVTHHLIDIVDASQSYSLDQYCDAAQQIIDDVRSRGREVLFVGGTPLYLKSLLRGIFKGPEADWQFREQVEAELKTVGVEALHARLAQVDPLSAAKLEPQNVRRIIRALEVQKITGQPISHLQEQFEVAHRAEECRVFVLDWPRPVLHQRIESRVERMFAEGLVAEVEQLLADGNQLGRTASQAVGYREATELIEGRATQGEAIERTIIRTRQFAKRQMTWFRSLSECRWITLEEPLDPAAVAQQIYEQGQR
jgi:tRNA dimethylallyltransferase